MEMHSHQSPAHDLTARGDLEKSIRKPQDFDEVIHGTRAMKLRWFGSPNSGGNLRQPPGRFQLLLFVAEVQGEAQVLASR